MNWTPLEIAANIMTAICIFLAGRNNIHTWWTGIVACILFGILFAQNQLYADATLQAFFLVTGVIGWYNWRKISTTKAYVNPITNVNYGTLVPMMVIALVTAGGYGFLLYKFTDAFAPWIDSLVLTFSVVAQLLLMRRNLQTWPVWLAVNTLSVPLFWSRELYMTSILYGFFWANAVYSWYNWNKISKEQE